MGVIDGTYQYGVIEDDRIECDVAASEATAACERSSLQYGF